MGSDPVIWAEEPLLAFSRYHRLRLFRNYRDIPSRTLFWWDKGILKFVQLRHEGGSSCALWIGAYRLPIPIFSFWTIYLEVPNDFSKKLADLPNPIGSDMVLNLLKKAKDEADSLEKKAVPRGETWETMRRSLFIPENLLTILLIACVAMVIVYLIIRTFL